jgi:hypothetical protein
MHPLLVTACACALSAPCLLAQGRVALSFAGGPRLSRAFSAASLGYGITSIGQVSMIPYPGSSAPGLYLGGASVRGLAAALGGRGDWDVVAFTYDRTTDRVTLNANAAALNTGGTEFALNWGSDGTYAVYDEFLGAHQATAAAPGGVLGAPTPISGIGVNFVDPCPSLIGGARVLFFIDPGGKLTWRAHDVATSSLSGPASVVCVPAGGNQNHSPWPLRGADGDAEALLGCEADSSFTASDWNWQGDLDAATPALVQFPTAVPFESNGCEAGGRIYMPQFTTVFVVHEYDVVALLGDTVPGSGGRADVTAIAPTRLASPVPDATIVLMGTSFATTPVPVPLTLNLFGLSPTGGFLVLGIGVHDPATGRATVSLQTPQLPPMQIPLQAMTILAALPAGPFHLSNTATITVTR